MNKDQFVALIPARGGSKGIKRKNIKNFCEKPLIYWTVKAAFETEEINTVYVATEDDTIWKTVEDFKLPKVKVVGRSKKTVSDMASTEAVMLEFAKKNHFKNIILIQATSPLLESKDLKKGIDIYLKKKADSLLSVVRQKRFLWKKNGKFYSPVNYDLKNRQRRQDFDGILVENGAFYITSRERLLETKCRLSGNIAIIEMESDSYFEIDELSDWTVSENLKRKKLAEKKLNKIDFARIKLLICDVDGVLTDGSMYYSKDGEKMKKFNTRDGKGIELLRKNGMKTMFLTQEKTDIVRKRDEKLKIDFLFMGITNKKDFLKQFFKKNTAYDFQNIAYIGDDLNDLECLKLAYFSAAPFNAQSEVKNIVNYVCNAKGGEGCVREVCNLILFKK